MLTEERDAYLSALAARWQAGDASAFAEIYNMTADAVEGYLRRWVRSTEVDDLKQEAYLRLIDARRTYRPDMPFRPWLFAIVRHTALDARRSRKRRALHESSDELVPEPAAPGPAEEHLDGVRLMEAMNALPEDQREVVWLARVQGMTSVEIGKVVGASPGAVKVRLHRATERLRLLFGAGARGQETAG
jgi:RNA polymerase sigma-70 factor (ECF subfamily)